MSTITSRIPKELILKIFGYVDSDTLYYSVPLVCRFFLLLARDSVLWRKFCFEEIYPEIGFTPSAIKPVENYWEEFQYQKRLNKLTESLFNKIVTDSHDRGSLVLMIPRLGQRAKFYLNSVYNSPTSTPRQRYYSRELLYAINQRASLIKILSTFYNTEDFDPFEFLLAFDAFYLDRSCTLGPSTELTYNSEISAVKAELSPLREHLSQTPASRQTRELYCHIAEKIGQILYSWGFINNVSDKRMNPRNVPGFFLSGVFSGERPSCSLVSAAIYNYFSQWVGLPSCLITMDTDVYIRIEDPEYLYRTNNKKQAPSNSNGKNGHNNGNLESHQRRDNENDQEEMVSDEECFFVDVNRAGKIRNVDEMMVIVQILQNSRIRRPVSLKPSARKDIILAFVRLFAAHYSLHQDYSKLSSVMFLGVLMFSFLSLVGECYRSLIDSIIPEELSSDRNDIFNIVNPDISNIPKSIFENLDTRFFNMFNTHRISLFNRFENNQSFSEIEEKLNQLYTMAFPPLIYHIPINLSMVYDFLFPYAPKAISIEEKRRAVTKISENISIEMPLVQPSFKKREKMSQKPKFHLGQVTFSNRTGLYGIIVGWGYISPENGALIEDDINEENPSLAELNTAKVQYIILLESLRISKVLEPSIVAISKPYERLLDIDYDFFSTESGRFFDDYDDNLCLFIPGNELRDQFPEERDFFVANTKMNI